MRAPGSPHAFLQSAKPLAFAHRGGASLWPENTLVAFQGAVDLGYRYLETDLHATRDGFLVCCHDPTVDRTTDGSGAISSLTLAELKRLDAGYRFSPDGGRTFPFRGKGVTIPALAEVVEALPDACLNVELKQVEPPIVEAVAALIEERSLHDRILAASFKDRVIRDFRRRAGPAVATSAATFEALRFWLASRLGLAPLLRPAYQALQVPVRQGELTIVDRRFVRAAHRAGLQVHVWTIDEPEEMRRLLDLGVDGLMSDRPDLLLEALSAAGSEPKR